MTANDPRRALIRRAGGNAGWATLSIAGLLVLWWLATDVTGLISPRTLPSPVAVGARLSTLASEPFANATLAEHIEASLSRWGLGVGLAILVGIPLGLAMAAHRDVDAVVTPVFEMVRYVPPLAWVPLAILWLGTGISAQALVVFLAAVPPCLLNAHQAISHLDPLLRAAAKTMGSSTAKELLWVGVPTGLPTILAGVTIGFTNGWMALIGAELVGAREGLGFMIVRGQENAAPDAILAAMVLIGLIGAAMTGVMRLVSARAVRWQTSQHTEETTA